MDSACADIYTQFWPQFILLFSFLPFICSKSSFYREYMKLGGLLLVMDFLLSSNYVLSSLCFFWYLPSCDELAEAKATSLCAGVFRSSCLSVIV